MTSSFNTWLAQFTQERTPRGGIARLAAADPRWPDGPDRLFTYTHYLERAGAPPAALQALTDTWIRYAARQ
ncbi:hypothetical protein ACWCP8_40565 [Streptomyces sp. NPDC002206]